MLLDTWIRLVCKHLKKFKQHAEEEGRQEKRYQKCNCTVWRAKRRQTCSTFVCDHARHQITKCCSHLSRLSASDGTVHRHPLERTKMQQVTRLCVTVRRFPCSQYVHFLTVDKSVNVEDCPTNERTHAQFQSPPIHPVERCGVVPEKTIRRRGMFPKATRGHS